jgi:hypothetical protein
MADARKPINLTVSEIADETATAIIDLVRQKSPEWENQKQVAPGGASYWRRWTWLAPLTPRASRCIWLIRFLPETAMRSVKQSVEISWILISGSHRPILPWRIRAPS